LQAIPCAPYDWKKALAHSRRLDREHFVIDVAQYEVKTILPRAGAWHRYLAVFEAALVRGMSAPYEAWIDAMPEICKAPRE